MRTIKVGRGEFVFVGNVGIKVVGRNPNRIEVHVTTSREPHGRKFQVGRDPFAVRDGDELTSFSLVNSTVGKRGRVTSVQLEYSTKLFRDRKKYVEVMRRKARSNRRSLPTEVEIGG